ncbi:hypothetical protein GCM10028824_17720 [Hymenobacter segetis]|uniref:ATP-binding protein n=1 Tax=Hymenobacter segetis TaxID=2025509 RepID=A0ABU9LXL0_9BACT
MRKNLYFIRTKYQLKRHSTNWKIRKRHATHIISNYFKRKNFNSNRKFKSYKVLVAPENFSFIENTNEVLNYFNASRNLITKANPVYLDISKISNLTPDTIALLMAKLSEKASKKAGFSGNAPTKPALKKLFIESGFYDYVKSNGTKVASQTNKLWKHSTNNEVVSQIAGNAKKACKDLLISDSNNEVSDPLYNLLVEAMSNTIHHAQKNNTLDGLNWWLYYYLDENTNTLKYSFIDLGIGIFKSANFNTFRKAFSYVYKGNMFLVKPFLDGQITSSRENDNEISGKGVRQILSCSALPEFKRFIIITNDVKIDVKTQQSEELDTNFEGTFIYWEVANVT